jgi:tetratricopeptide (TPR) repeat protein
LLLANGLGWTYLLQGQPAAALPLMEPTLAARRRILGPNHRKTLLTQQLLATTYQALRRPADAEPLLADLLALHRQQMPPNSPQLADTLAQLGLCRVQGAKFADAEPVLRECLSLREKLATDPKPAVLPWQVANTRSLLGAALFGQGKHAEAESLLVQGWEGLRAQEAAVPPQGRANLPAALARLVQLHEAIGKPDEAARYRAELAKRLTAELTRDLTWPLLWGWPR